MPNILGAMTDFSLILGQLRADGMTQLQIAVAAGCGVSTIADLEHKEGREPRYSLGSRLVALHAERFSKNTARKSARAKRKKD